MNLTNEIIDHKYQISNQLGEGGASFVYSAFDLSSQTKVVVKILKEKVTSPFIEDFIRFKREIEIISKLDHPYIMKAYYAGEYQHHPYLVTEYLEGQSLADSLQSSQLPQNLETVIEIIKKTTEALNYIHCHGVIHRDLKPGNIFLIPNPKLSIKLLDFGVAHLLEPAEIKDEREIAGTFGFMSPEASGILNRRVDERSDLYSLGVIFYRLLTGEPPFKDKEVSRLLHSQAAVIPPRPGQINRQIPTTLDEMVMKLLEKDPDLRYQTASGLLDDLEKYQKGEREFPIGAGDRKIKLTFQTRLVGRDQELKEEKKPLLITDAMIDAEFQKQSSVVLSGIRSVIASPIMMKEEALGVLYLDNRLLSGIFDEKDLQVLDLIANQAGVSIENARLYRRIKHYSQEIEKSRDEIAGWNQTLEQRVVERTEQLEAANRVLQEYASVAEELAVARERNRITRDVHDTLGQTLSVLVSLLEKSRCIYESKSGDRNQVLGEAVNIARGGLKEIRRSIKGLLQDGAIYDAATGEGAPDANFRDIFEKMINGFRMSGMKVDFSAVESLPKLSQGLVEIIYRVCQESLTNSLKHGKATEVNILLSYADNWVKLYIFDNGCGCKNLDQNTGYGLRGMRQRVESLKGSIEFGSDGEKGFHICAEIPLEGGMP